MTSSQHLPNSPVPPPQAEERESWGTLVDSRLLAPHRIHHPGKPDGVFNTKVIQSNYLVSFFVEPCEFCRTDNPVHH